MTQIVPQNLVPRSFVGEVCYTISEAHSPNKMFVSFINLKTIQ